MFELERDQIRKTYQLCRMAFVLLAIALVPASILHLLSMLLTVIGDRHLVIRIDNSPLTHWVNTACIWSSLVGAMLLWGRWDHTSWQRRSGLFLVMCIVDMVVWFMGRSENPAVQNDWFLRSLGEALGWAEFALIASLSGDYLVHLGVGQAEDSAKSTRSLAATGAVIWLLTFCELTHWDGGWPLHRKNFNMHALLLSLGWQLIWTITLVQVTLLVIAAMHQTNRTLAEMETEDGAAETVGWPDDPRPKDLFAGSKAKGFGSELL